MNRWMFLPVDSIVQAKNLWASVATRSISRINDFATPWPWWAGLTDKSRMMHTPATVQKRTDPTTAPSASATKICFSLASSLRLSSVSVVHPLTV